jgi:hypothetical protein
MHLSGDMPRARDADIRTVSAALRFTLLLALIALMAALLAIRERPQQHGASAAVPAVIR